MGEPTLQEMESIHLYGRERIAEFFASYSLDEMYEVAGKLQDAAEKLPEEFAALIGLGVSWLLAEIVILPLERREQSNEPA